LISHLTTELYKISFYRLFDTIIKNGLSIENFWKNLELIVTDFSLPQQNGIRTAIKIIETEQNIEMKGVEEKLSGCFYHFKQSSLRLKNKLTIEDSNLFESHIQKLEKCYTLSSLKEQFQKIKYNIPQTKNWCNWWSQDIQR
jgi:hypothetical protein